MSFEDDEGFYEPDENDLPTECETQIKTIAQAIIEQQEKGQINPDLMKKIKGMI